MLITFEVIEMSDAPVLAVLQAAFALAQVAKVVCIPERRWGRGGGGGGAVLVTEAVR